MAGKDTLGLFSQSRKDLDRIAAVLNILARFQMGQLADRIRIGERLPVRLSGRNGRGYEYKTPQERVRIMLEELGTTFIKFGQLLSTRSDIVGRDYAQELSKLQDSTRPFPGAQARRVVEEELGRPISEVFSRFDDEPLASASVAQVHRAVLKNGTKVVVKVQRPGIEGTIREDLRIMHYLAHLASKYIPEARKYDPEYLVDEFERSMRKELDFLREAKSAERLRENFKGDKGVYIPLVYRELSTKKVMTMEEVGGTRLSDLIKSGSKGFDRRLIARRCVEAFFKMVMVDGFYHADMHPGNIMVMKGDRICLIDFGRVGTIDKEVADNIFRMALFAVDNDVKGLIEHLVRTDMMSEPSEMDNLKADMSDVLDAYYSDSVENVEIAQMLSDVVDVVGNYQFNRPRELAELTRALLIVEGVAMQLYPKFSIAGEFGPYARKMLRPGSDVHRITDIISNNIMDLEYMARTFPMALRRLMKKLDEGKLKVELEHKDLAYFSNNLENIGSTLSAAMIIAAMIVGSALIVTADKWLGLTGFAISIILGILLLLKTILY